MADVEHPLLRAKPKLDPEEARKLSGRERRKRGLGPLPKRRVKPTLPGPPVLTRAEKYDRAMLKQAVAFVEADGDYPVDAWLRAGGNRRTFDRYHLKARLGVEPYVAIIAELNAASARHCAKWVKVAFALAVKKSDANTMKNLLQARHKQWSPRQEVVVMSDPHAMLLLQVVAEKVQNADLAEDIYREFERRSQSSPRLPEPAGGGEGGEGA